MRSDEATHILGIRINVFTSLVVFLGAVIYLLVVRGKREDPALLAGKPYPDDIPSTTAPGKSGGTEDSRDRTADGDDPDPKRNNGDESENSDEDASKNADEGESKGSDGDEEASKETDEVPAEPATTSKKDDGKATKSETDTKDAKTQS
jgi:hypothetical protein